MSSRLAESVRACAAAAVLCAAGSVTAEAQAATAAEGPYVIERREYDRWVHEGQHPAFVPFEIAHGSVHVRATAPPGGGIRSLTVQQDRMVLDPRNRILSLTVEQPMFTVSRYESPRQQAENRRRRLRGQGALLSLPPARLWEIPFTLPGRALAPGVAWTDTLSFDAAAEGMWERLEGIWRHQVVGDTVVAGQTLPLVATEAALRYTARELTSDESMDTLLVVLRDVAGQLHGRAAVDTVVGVRAAGSDSTRLEGTATLLMGDGPPLVSGVHYDRLRTWLLRDSLAWAASRDSAAEERRRQDTGMLLLPRTPAEERARQGDTAVTDSLLQRWIESSDPEERRRITMLLAPTGARASSGLPWRDQLLELRLLAGDTVAGVERALSSASGRPEVAPLVLGFLDNPVRLWRLGMLPRRTYMELANRLMAATPLLEPDTARWPCAPENCAAFLAMVHTAAEPRLRDAALAGAFAREPARWWDRVVARADSGSLIAARARQLGDGVAATWPAAPQAPVPAADAGWRDWLDWMGGTDRWGRNHIDAVRIHGARTGRDVAAELLRDWPPAGDSAQLVVGTVLRHLDALPEPTAAQLAAAVLASSAAAREGARREVAALLRSHGRPAADGLALELLRPLLDSIATGGSAPWLDADGRPVGIRTMGGGFHGVRDVPVFVLADSLPAGLADALPPAFTPISGEAWRGRPLREGGVIVVMSPVLEWGDFVTVRVDWRSYRRRAPDEAPAGYAGGGTLTLVRTDDGWRVIDTRVWIT